MSDTPDKIGSETTTNLGEALPREIARCQEILANAVSIGPAGTFLAMMLRRDLAAASKATIEGDLVEMIRVYKVLKGYKQ